MSNMGGGFRSTIGQSGTDAGSPWIGLLVIGIMMTAGSVFAFAASASNYDTAETDPFYEMDRDAGRMFAIFGSITLVLGLVFIGLSFMVKRNEIRRLEARACIAEEARARNVQDIANIVKSTIKIRCRYCGTLNDENDSKCESCGAAL